MNVKSTLTLENWIDSYVEKVGQYLPGRQREDIAKELRSTIQDMLDDRIETSDEEPTQEALFDILRELGSPRKVASAYLPDRYLIGPHLYPLYLRVVAIVLAVLGVVSLVGYLALLTWLQPLEVLQALPETFASFVTSAFSALGWTVLIFAILERAGARTPEELDKPWDPQELDPAKSKDQFKSSSLMLDIGSIIAALIIFNFYPQWIGAGNYSNGVWTFIPLLAEDFSRIFLPLINIYWALKVILSLIVLRQGQWRAETRWASIGMDIFGIVILLKLIAGPSVIRPLGEIAVQVGLANVFTNTGLADLAGGFNSIFILFLILAVLKLLKKLKPLLEAVKNRI